MADTYYDRRQLGAFGTIARGNRDLADKFFAYYGSVFADGKLSVREKALTALAVAHVVQCPYCIDAYTKGSLEAGADLDQMTEAVHVGASVRAASTAMYGMQMRTQAGRMQMEASASAPVPGYFAVGHVDELPALADGARALYDGLLGYDAQAAADSALDAREKALVALACAHAIQCPYSIDRAVRRLSELEVPLDEMTEAVHVAAAIRGGASLVHGVQMLEHFDSLQKGT